MHSQLTLWKQWRYVSKKKICNYHDWVWMRDVRVGREATIHVFCFNELFDLFWMEINPVIEIPVGPLHFVESCMCRLEEYEDTLHL